MLSTHFLYFLWSSLKMQSSGFFNKHKTAGVISIVLLLMFFSNFATALTVNRVLIKGNKIVAKEAIRSKISSKAGQKFRLRSLRQDVRQIFNTGWFYEVEVKKRQKKNKVTLIYQVREKPVVGRIIYKGNKSLSKKDLEEIFPVSVHAFLNHKKLKAGIESLKKEYEKKGYYLAEISYQIKPTDHAQKVHLIIHIRENKKIKVKRIHFIGNHSISTKEIKSFMGTREAGLLSFISSAGSYNSERFQQDLNNIRFIYMDRGYWKVFVGKPEVFVSPDKRDLSINIPIQEGDQYKAGSLDFTGDLMFDKEYLRKGLETEEGEVFSYGELQRDIKQLETKYGDKGYAFVNIIPKFFNLPGDDSKTIHVMFEIQKGKKTKLREIHIKGNHYTRDKVIRRELRIFEGELYSETGKNQSVSNIQRLGFFDEVKIIRKTIKKKDDLMDMEVLIKERENTGTLEIGAGYDGVYKFVLTGKVHKLNLFGKGYKAGLDFSINKNRQYVNLNFSDPYFLDSRWYFGWDFYLDQWEENESSQVLKACEHYDERKAEHEKKLSAGGWKEEERQKSEGSLKNLQKACWNSFPTLGYRGFGEQKLSGGLTFGYSLTDSFKILFYHRLEHVSLENAVDEHLYPVKSASGFRNPLEAILEYDKRNDRVFPTQGMYSRTSLAYDGLFGKFDYWTLSANMRFYQTLFWKLVFRVNVQYSQHLFHSDSEEVPFDRLFLLGGLNSLRGFRYFAVGPRKKSEFLYQKALEYQHPNPSAISSRVFGGTKELYTNMELQFPILPKARLLGVLFVDIGSAYNDWSSIDLRANWGLGLRIFSPLGPVRVEMGFPFEPRPGQGENNSEFQFTMGLPF